MIFLVSIQELNKSLDEKTENFDQSINQSIALLWYMPNLFLIDKDFELWII